MLSSVNLVDRLGIEPSSHALQACAGVTRLAHDPFKLVRRAGFEPARSNLAPRFQSGRSDLTELPTVLNWGDRPAMIRHPSPSQGEALPIKLQSPLN